MNCCNLCCRKSQMRHLLGSVVCGMECIKHGCSLHDVTHRLLKSCCETQWVAPWMYYRIWIQSLSQASVHSYESCSVLHDAKNDDFPGLKIPDQTLLLRLPSWDMCTSDSSSSSECNSSRASYFLFSAPLARMGHVWDTGGDFG